MTKQKTQTFSLHPIGKIRANEEKGKFSIEIAKPFRAGLKELEHYSHVHVYWWADKHDNLESRNLLQTEQLPPFYGENAPSMGVFATRAEYRPNPIAITTCPIISLNQATGIITVPWMDAFDGTPVIDLKPYIKMTDRINQASYPPYLKHWPDSQESAMDWWMEQQG